jgi:hypothetical protein
MKQNGSNISAFLNVLIALAIMTALFSVAWSQTDEKSETPLTGAAIMDKYVETTGGAKAYEDVKNQFIKSTMVMSVGVTINIIAYNARPALFYSKAESKEIGTMEQGYDGQVCWERSLAQGPRIIEGAELQDMLRDNVAMDKTNNWRNYYDSAVLVGADSVNGALANKVVVYPKEDKPQTFYFDQNSALLVKVEATYESQMGEIPMESYLSDYKKNGNLLMPGKTVIKFMGQDQVMTIDSVAYNVEIPPDLFKLPDDIKALIKPEQK